MLQTPLLEDRLPRPDPAEFDAFFPSPYSLRQAIPPRELARVVRSEQRYAGKPWRILVVATSERYLETLNGKIFSTGNHPVATLLPMYHLYRAGFGVDVATLGGLPVKFEKWAMPWEDTLLTATYAHFRLQLRSPLNLADITRAVGQGSSPYLGLFIPGGHGAMLGLPGSAEMKAFLGHMIARRRMIITICHGAAALLAASINLPRERHPLRGYSLCAFPDEVNRRLTDDGYVPGPLPWHLGSRLRESGLNVINTDITGTCHLDRELLTGDSPWASDLLGRMAVESLIDLAAEQ